MSLFGCIKPRKKIKDPIEVLGTRRLSHNEPYHGNTDHPNSVTSSEIRTPHRIHGNNRVSQHISDGKDDRQQIEILRKQNESLRHQLYETDEFVPQFERQLQTSSTEYHENTDRWADGHMEMSRSDRYMGQAIIADGDNMKRMTKVGHEIRQLKQKLTGVEKELQATNDRLRTCERERNDYRDRLSQYTANKLMDNNPNITDLSDSNRPTKLLERFSELYDNQWCDAFEELTTDGMSSKAAIKSLLDALRTVFETCARISHEQLRTLEQSILVCICSEKIPDHLSTHMKLYKEERKKHYASGVAGIRKEVLQALGRKECQTKGKEHRKYIKEATSVCWLMCIQDPPLELIFDCNVGGEFNKDIFRSYTKSGKALAFLVWPVLHQYKGGPVMSKGVAQCKKKKKTQKERLSRDNRTQITLSSISDIEDDNKEQISTVRSASVAQCQKEKKDRIVTDRNMKHNLNVEDAGHDFINHDVVHDSYDKENTQKRAPPLDSQQNSIVDNFLDSHNVKRHRLTKRGPKRSGIPDVEMDRMENAKTISYNERTVHSLQTTIDPRRSLTNMSY